MSPTKQILLLVTQVVFCAVCLAQTEQIDSLKKVLFTVKDTARINCLNALGEIYQNTQTDSALLYSYKALSEANGKQYTKGVAKAFFSIAISYADRGDYKSAEQNYRLSISNYEKLSNLDALGSAYLWFGVTLYAQANFQSATKAFIKADELLQPTNWHHQYVDNLFFILLKITYSKSYSL